MIREPKSMEQVSLTVVTVDGEVFEKVDTTSAPFGEQERVVGFWAGDTLRILPMSQVRSVTLHFD